MVNLQAIYIANGAAALLLAVVLLSRKRSIRYGLFDEKLYSAMVWVCMALCVLETLTFAIDGRDPVLFRVPALIFNSLLFSMNIVLILIWTVYIDYKLFEDLKHTHRVILPMAIPAVIIILGSIINLFRPVYFSVSPENIYGRAALHALPFLISYVYLIYGVVLVYANRKNSNRYLFLPVMVFLIPVFIASLLQYLFYGISLLWLGVAIGIVSLYINVQNQATYIDSLSGVFNRQYLGFFLESWSVHRPQDERLIGFMLDIDEFKLINDCYGHLAGDAVISEVGAMLRSVTMRNGFAARYGGDEFLILQTVKRDGNVEQKIQDVCSALSALPPKEGRKFSVSLSVGTSIFLDNDSVDSFINRIDSAMYEEKKKKIEQSQFPDRRRRT